MEEEDTDSEKKNKIRNWQSIVLVVEQDELDGIAPRTTNEHMGIWNVNCDGVCMYVTTICDKGGYIRVVNHQFEERKKTKNS